MLISSDNTSENIIKKQALIEEISAKVVDELTKHKLTDISSQELERQAYSVNDRIKNADIRNLNILYAV